MKNILEFLEATAPRHPDKTALADDTEQLSFAAFAALARAGGSALLRRGLRGEPVAVFMKKSPRTLCAFFAVIYAGCYYVPLDAGMPKNRVAMILEKLNPRLILSDGSGDALLAELGWADRAADAAELLAEPEDPAALAAVRARATDTDPVYIVFTSGSTGMPKGVMACHRSVIDYANAVCPVIGADGESVFAMQVPLFVDACLKELLSVIRCGSTAWLMPQKLFLTPVKAVEWLNERGVNTLCWVASALTMLSGLGAFEDVRPRGLRTVCFSSEVFPVKQLRLWRAAAPEARFINFYGPTECTGISFYYVVDRDFAEGEAVPVGRPFDNTGYFLLKEDGTEALPGEEGEICIRGTCVTLGYYADPERTAAAFVQNPLNPLWPERVYRTGDMGYVNPAGELMFVSRRDNQIKNMGHRIELGEIEAAAAGLEGVESACCLWDEEKKKLILFYMGTAEEKDTRALLRGVLPRHMLPARLTRLDALPLLPNGKLDRAALKTRYMEGREHGRSH